MQWLEDHPPSDPKSRAIPLIQYTLCKSCHLGLTKNFLFLVVPKVEDRVYYSFYTNIFKVGTYKKKHNFWWGTKSKMLNIIGILKSIHIWCHKNHYIVGSAQTQDLCSCDPWSLQILPDVFKFGHRKKQSLVGPKVENLFKFETYSKLHFWRGCGPNLKIEYCLCKSCQMC